MELSEGADCTKLFTVVKSFMEDAQEDKRIGNLNKISASKSTSDSIYLPSTYWQDTHTHIHLYMSIHLHINIYLSVCMCVYACEYV